MSTHTTQNKPLKVAAPYYGSLNHPNGGLSNLFFVLDVNTEGNRVANMHVTVWNPKDDNKLGSWLQHEGINTFFCNKIETCHRQEISESGIKIEAITGRDIVDGIKTWLIKAGANLINQAGHLPA